MATVRVCDRCDNRIHGEETKIAFRTPSADCSEDYEIEVCKACNEAIRDFSKGMPVALRDELRRTA